MSQPVIRPTASTINDDQVDVVFDTLHQVWEAHYPHEPGDWCVECGRRTPCDTSETIRKAWEKIGQKWIQLELPLESA